VYKRCFKINTILDVNNLEVNFYYKNKTVKVVRKVNFTIYKGEIFGLIGESGCGKSTILLSILRLIKDPGRISGSVIYKGVNLLELSEKEMNRYRGREIGMTFQEPITALNPVLTIGEQICDAFKDENLSKSDKEEKAINLLKIVGIPSEKQRLSEYPHQFSGGMRQRAMIASILASEPKLLLADEPTTALDVTIQDQIIKLINNLKKKFNMSVILVTHDLGVVAEMCDRVAVMYAGQIMEIADVVTLFSEPRHPYTIGLIQSTPRKIQNAKLHPIEGSPPDLTNIPGGCPFEPRCRYKEKICKEELPELLEIKKGHFSRCHFIKKLKNEKGIIEL